MKILRLIREDRTFIPYYILPTSHYFHRLRLQTCIVIQNIKLFDLISSSEILPEHKALNFARLFFN